MCKYICKYSWVKPPQDKWSNYGLAAIVTTVLTCVMSYVLFLHNTFSNLSCVIEPTGFEIGEFSDTDSSLPLSSILRRNLCNRGVSMCKNPTVYLFHLLQRPLSAWFTINMKLCSQLILQWSLFGSKRWNTLKNMFWIKFLRLKQIKNIAWDNRQC